jgi:beta-mannosidase
MSRIVWPSCPASGWASGVHKLTGLPTGGALVTRADSKKGGKIEVHGPYRQGTGIPSINPGGRYYQFQAPSLEPGATGTQYSSVFISEFGSVVMSSFESMSSTLEPKHWSVHGGTSDQDKCTGEHTTHCEGDNVMGWRNHMPDNQIAAFFGQTNLSGVGPAAFQEQLYKSMVAQALDMKREIEEQRSRNSFGMLVWQLGEVWPTGGWWAGRFHLGLGPY